MWRIAISFLFGTSLMMQLAAGAQEIQGLSNHFYTKSHNFMGKKFAFFSPGYSVRTAFGASFGLDSIVALYNQAQKSFSEPMQYPNDRFFDQCTASIGCYWQPRNTYTEAFVPITDFVLVSYSSDRYSRLLKFNSLKEFQAELEELKTNDSGNIIRKFEERIGHELDVKTQNTIYSHLASFFKSQNMVSSSENLANRGLPESLFAERLLVAHKQIQATDIDTMNECLLVEGDILRITSYRSVEALGARSQKEIIASLKIVKSLPLKSSCKIDSDVEIDFNDIIEMENTFQRKVEEGLIRVAKAKLLRIPIQEIKAAPLSETIASEVTEASVASDASAGSDVSERNAKTLQNVKSNQNDSSVVASKFNKEISEAQKKYESPTPQTPRSTRSREYGSALRSITLKATEKSAGISAFTPDTCSSADKKALNSLNQSCSEYYQGSITKKNCRTIDSSTLLWANGCMRECQVTCTYQKN